MRTKRILISCLVLLFLLAILGWKFLPGIAKVGDRSVVDSATKRSGALVAKSKPAGGDLISLPITPAVKAAGGAEAQLPLTVYDLGEMEFSDGVRVVRTLATGETCIFFPKVADQDSIFVRLYIIKAGDYVQQLNTAIKNLGENELMAQIAYLNQKTSFEVTAASLGGSPGEEVNMTLTLGPHDGQVKVRIIPKIVAGGQGKGMSAQLNASESSRGALAPIRAVPRSPDIIEPISVP